MQYLITALALFVLSSSSASAEFRQFPDHQMSIVFPTGFTEIKGQRVPAGTLVAYAKGDVNDGQAHSVIGLEILGGTIGKDSHLTDAQLPKAIRDLGFKVGKMKWNGHSIDTIVGTMTQNGVSMTSLVVQIPLAPKALQISFAAPIEERDAMNENASKVVSSVIGLSNWDGPVMRKLSWAERAQKITTGSLQLIAVCAFAIFIYRSIKRKQTVQPPST